ncbi:MAG: hypothetical protein KIS96_11770 [Bauldia sp.]|nr:hypothetical protein [Bauldia sp.]
MTIPKMKFDGTINFGHLFTALSVLLAGATMAVMFNSRLGLVETSVATHDTQIASIRTDLSALLPVMAVDQQRLNQLEAANERTAAIIERMDGRLTQIQVDLSALRAATLPATRATPP